MAELKLEVSLDSDALVNNQPEELALIFAKLTKAMADPDWKCSRLWDSNGNQVGMCWMEED